MAVGITALVMDWLPDLVEHKPVYLSGTVFTAFWRASIFAVSLTPLIAITLLNKYNSSTPIAWYLAGASLISIVAVALIRETRDKSRHEVDAESAARVAAHDNAQATDVRQGKSLA